MKGRAETDLRIGRVWVAGQQAVHVHHHPRSAEPALRAVPGSDGVLMTAGEVTVFSHNGGRTRKAKALS